MPELNDHHKHIDNPFIDGPQRIQEYTAKEVARLQLLLDKQLGPEYLSTRTGGGGSKLYYITGEKVINLANDIFGFNGWSSSIQQVQIDFCDENLDTGRVNIGLSIICRVTLRDGTFHEDIGYGNIENGKGKAAAFEKAKKEAATDALKRALRSFGNVLGNCIYDKNYLQKVSRIKVGPAKWHEDQLYRHPDYRTEQRQQNAPLAVEYTAQPQLHDSKPTLSNVSDFDDDLGGTLFDGVELDAAQADEATLSETTLSDITGDSRLITNCRTTVQTPQTKESIQRQQSHPVTTNEVRNHVAKQQQHDQRSNLARPGQVSYGSRRHLSTDMSTGNTAVEQTDSMALQGQSGAQAHGNRGTSTGVGSTINTPQFDTTAGKYEGPSLFVTGRSAEALQQQGPDAPIPANATAFNPHLESPSLRRTNGVNHSKSVPIARTSLGNGGNIHQNHTIPPGGPQQQHTPATRGNILNPQFDANRKIGMPGVPPYPTANRNRVNHRPPTLGQQKRNVDSDSRPPLADLKNVSTNGGGDSLDLKRQKVMN